MEARASNVYHVAVKNTRLPPQIDVTRNIRSAFRITLLEFLRLSLLLVHNLAAIGSTWR